LQPYDLFIATTPAEEANKIVDYDDKMASLYDWVANECTAHKHSMGYNLKQAIGDVNGKKCLEAACGNGAYMQFMYDKGSSFVCGVDLSAENLEICRKNHKAAGVRLDAMCYRQGDLGKAELYSGGPFDVAVMGCCICYCSSQEMLVAWLRNMYNNLKPGGRLVCINTRGALPEAKQKELKEKFNVEYLVEDSGGSKSFSSPAMCIMPNGWRADYIFLEAQTIHDAMVEVGFQVERRQMVPDPDYNGKEDLARMVQLQPYDLFIATTPAEEANKTGCIIA